MQQSFVLPYYGLFWGYTFYPFSIFTLFMVSSFLDTQASWLSIFHFSCTELHVAQGCAYPRELHIRKCLTARPSSLLSLRRSLVPIVIWLYAICAPEPVQAFEARSSINDERQSGRIASDICDLPYVLFFRFHVLLR